MRMIFHHRHIGVVNLLLLIVVVVVVVVPQHDDHEFE